MSYRSIFAPALFQNQVVLVTGGGSGIGRCTAHELAALGARVVLVGRKLDKLQRVAQEIAEDGGQADCHALDIRNEEAVQALVAAVLAEHGRIDGLVNNAGGQFMAPLESISAKGWEAVVNTNLTGGFLVARACYTQCMARQGGAIVNVVADMWGSMPGMGHSGAARAGMVSFTETAAVEWGPQGVRVNAVAPGYVASSGMDNYPETVVPLLRQMTRTVPLGRFATEAEISAGIVYLLSPAASFVNGTTLRIDAGRPQVRMGWPMQAADEATRQRPAIRPFEGFHRAITPRMFATAAEPSAASDKPAPRQSD